MLSLTQEAAKMTKAEKVEYFYNQNLWDKNRVKNAVVKGWISSSDYERIVGETYKEG